jgi:bifunctional UDP-N-acetylglucosamine pyrophosphorylase/glucosamine-1-phosphate N-acetyltransferase
MPLSVVILAAGQGKRMNSDLPKVLQPLAGRPLLAHVVAAAAALEPDDIYVVYGHGGAQVQQALAAERIEWVLQAQQLGTGHAVMQAMPLIPDEHEVLVLYGDVPLVRTDTLRTLVDTAIRDAQGVPSLALLSVAVSDPSGYGRIMRDAGGDVCGIIEHRDATAAQREIREINTGLMAASARELRRCLLEVKSGNDQGEFYLTDVVAIAVQAGTAVRAVTASSPAEVQGVNDKIQLAEAEAGLRRERALDLMRRGATLADPARIDIRGTLSIGRDVSIDVNAVFVGEVHLGDGVSIAPNCIVADSRIGAGTQVFANSMIDRSQVGRHCRIGPFARLRPGSELGDEVHIGNFVETKNATLGEGSKANHLSYVGDATVGRDVNIGAGSITCNYDGENKWSTVIDDGAFIGSGSMLVAPVRIGTNATIGAGSTITSNAPDDKLTLERARQTTIDAWQRPRKLDDKEKAVATVTALAPDAATQRPVK